MARSRSQKRLMAAAFGLFTSQGFNLTTTKQIADLAQVNEATLFRNFGGKHDLLLAVITESEALTQSLESLPEILSQTPTTAEALRLYVRDRLQIFTEQAALLRAVVGEAGQYSPEQRQTLQATWQQVTQVMATDLAHILNREPGDSASADLSVRSISPHQLAALLTNLLLGFVVSQDFDQSVWPNSEAFVDCLINNGLGGRSAIAPPASAATIDNTPVRVRDLSADLVRQILQRAKKLGPQPYAIAYLLFGAGLLPQELLNLKRSQHLCNPRQNVVQINQGAVRQVPINQWIMGKRYGSYSNNPLTQWLKSRKDELPALFINESQQPLCESDLQAIWEATTHDLLTLDNTPPQLVQARQTWCVEMLTKGMNPEDLSILSGWTTQQLQPYVERTREKVALERAMQLDQKSN